ncbi:MAG: GSCFA domain-containing protein [Luteibaculaceae bacterium]
MQFKINPPDIHIPQTLSVGDKVCFLGSCFSEHMASKLNTGGFEIAINPSGIMFNPESMALGAEQIARGNSKNYLFQRNELWFSWLHHSSFFGNSPEDLLTQINRENAKFLETLQKAKYLVITSGTAYCYRHIEKDFVVGNCHKMPAGLFLKNRLSVEECLTAFKRIEQFAKMQNPDIKFLIAVSPVRHLRDGLEQNNLSKSTLLLATHQWVEQCRNAYYFPSYEILIDELRDYRFYAHDFAHPNELAVEYIWGLLKNSWVSERAKEFINLNEQLEKALAHKPKVQSMPEQEKFALFVQQLREKLKQFV